MTPTEHPENPVAVFEIDELLKKHVEAYNQKISELLVEYNVAHEEASNAEENRRRFEKSALAATAAAEAINLKIRESLRQRSVDTKEAHKKRAERAGYLNDVEIYTSMADESIVSRKRAELVASVKASEIASLRRQARAVAEAFLSDLIKKKVSSEFREITLFVDLITEIASNRESLAYRENQAMSSPIDFALGELGKLFSTALKERTYEPGSSAFLISSPESIGNDIRTPLQVKKLQEDIAAAEAAL